MSFWPSIVLVVHCFTCEGSLPPKRSLLPERTLRHLPALVSIELLDVQCFVNIQKLQLFVNSSLSEKYTRDFLFMRRVQHI